MQDFWAINIVTGYVLIFVRFKTSSIQRDSGIHFSWPTAQVQIDVRQAEALFDVLDYNNSGTLDSEEFLEAWSLGGHWIKGIGKVLEVVKDLWHGHFPEMLSAAFPRKDEQNRRFRESLRSRKKTSVFPLRGHHVSTRRSSLQGGHCNTVRSLEGPLFDIWGHWETGWWSKKLIEISIKVDSTLKNLFFFSMRSSNLKGTLVMQPIWIWTNLEVGRMRWNYRKQRDILGKVMRENPIQHKEERFSLGLGASFVKIVSKFLGTIRFRNCSSWIGFLIHQWTSCEGRAWYH